MNQTDSSYKQVQLNLIERFEVFQLLNRINFLTICKKCGVRKQQGVLGVLVLQSLLLITFVDSSIHHFIKHCKIEIFKVGGKDVYYRFCQRMCINWRLLLTLLVVCFHKRFLNNKTWDKRVLVLDDTVIEKSGKHIEELSWIFDHTKHKSVPGFQALTLGVHDGISFLPVDFSLTSGSKKIAQSKRQYDGRTHAAKRHAEAGMSKNDLAFKMLQHAKKHAITAPYVLFDSWFCHTPLVSKIYDEIGSHVISMAKVTPKQFIEIKGEKITTKRLLEKYPKKKLSKTVHFGSVKIKLKSVIAKFGQVDVKLVICHPVGNKMKSILLLSTDLQLSEKEILELYKKRWPIEVLFKEAKQKHGLGKPSVRSFDSAIALLTISMIRHLLISFLQREQNDFRERGNLFETIKCEIEEINQLKMIETFIKLLKSITKNTNLENDVKKIEMTLINIANIIKQSIEEQLFTGCET